MGENSKKIGEHGEKTAKEFFEQIGWTQMLHNMEIECQDENHLRNDDKEKMTHGIDLFYSYMNPLSDGQLINVVISVKYKQNEPYPKSATKKFRDYMRDLNETIDCFKISEYRMKIIEKFQYERELNLGILFWLNGSDPEESLIPAVSMSPLEVSADNILMVIDNRQYNYLLNLVKFLKMQETKYDWNFYYPITGQNLDVKNRKSFGKLLPIEYLSSPIQLIKIVEKDNPKAISLMIATSEKFDRDVLSTFIGLAKDLNNELTYRIIIAYPDYDRLKHDNAKEEALLYFNDTIKKNVELVNYNSLSTL